jgi:hypothetical protein
VLVVLLLAQSELKNILFLYCQSAAAAAQMTDLIILTRILAIADLCGHVV